MNFGTKVLLPLLAAISIAAATNARADGLRATVLKDAAINAGFLPAEEINLPFDEKKAAIGEKLFGSDLLSINSDISCRACHLPQFSSTDGLPNAIGVRGEGEGQPRLRSDGDIVPRNSLPLWGRGGSGFNVFFWDGKVKKDQSSGTIISQFGSDLPSNDPLKIAIHLPIVEFREMVDDTRADGLIFEDETVDAASRVFKILIERVRMDPDLSLGLRDAYEVMIADLEIDHIVDSIAHFIRREFRVRDTKFHKFVFEKGRLTAAELRGGLVFYGKGRCASCHKGAQFTDFDFHAVPFLQAGFGKNGFGVDYGRYNVTFDPADLYRFRTPPLFNVQYTAPYSHSGSVNSIEEAILSHVDPLTKVTPILNSERRRQEFYRKLQAWAQEGIILETLSLSDVKDLTAFLESLSFCAPNDQVFCDEDQ